MRKFHPNAKLLENHLVFIAFTMPIHNEHITIPIARFFFVLTNNEWIRRTSFGESPDKGKCAPWWGLSAGISMPAFDNRSSVNITYSFDQLGTLNDGLILQQSQQIMFDIIIRDLWGIRRKFD